MSPLEYIEEGIREGNWKTVCEGYERLTGKALPLPTERNLLPSVTMSNEEKALRKIVDIISTALTEEEDSSPTEKTSKKKKSGRPKGKRKKTAKKKSTEEDSSLILDENKKTTIQKEVGGTRLITNKPDPEEVERNKIKAEKANQNKIKLNRKPTTTYNIKCNECENTFKSNRQNGEIGQKCPGCLKEKKSRFV